MKKFTHFKSILTLTILCVASFKASSQYTAAYSYGVDGRNEEVYGTGVDAQGNYHIIGKYSNSTDTLLFNGQQLIELTVPFGSVDGLLWAKYDANDNLVFVKSFAAAKDTSESGTLEDAKMAVSASGEVVISGNYTHSLTIENTTLTATQTGWGENNLFVAKFDNSGNLSWLKNIDTHGATCMDIAFDQNGDVVFAGAFDQDFDAGNSVSHSGSSSIDWGFLCRMAGTDGTAQALEIFEEGHPRNIDINGSGEIALIGFFDENQMTFSDGTTLDIATPETNSNLKGNCFVSKFSSALAPVWITQVRGNAMGTEDIYWANGGIKAMLNNTHYLAIGTDSIDTETHAIANFDASNGSVSSIVECETFLFGMTSDGSKSYLSTQQENGNNDLIFGTFTDNTVDKFILFEIDANDDVQWVESAGSFSANVEAKAMAIKGNTLIIGGDFRYGGVTLATGITITPTAGFYEDAWFAKYKTSGGSSIAEAETTLVNLYPNPTNGTFTLDLNGLIATDLVIEILSINGQRIYKSEALNQASILSIDALKNADNGLYLLHIKDQAGKVIQTKKVVKL